MQKTNPTRTPNSRNQYQQEKGEIPGDMDVDHTIDLQLGGEDTIDNKAPLDSSVNRSFGSQIQNQISDQPAGASINGVKLE